LFRREEYARAGLKVMPNELGELATKEGIIAYTGALVATTLLLYPLGVAGRAYLVSSFVLGCVFLAWSCLGMRVSAGPRWARSLFAYSIVYLVLLFAVLGGDGRVVS